MSSLFFYLFQQADRVEGGREGGREGGIFKFRSSVLNVSVLELRGLKFDLLYYGI